MGLILRTSSLANAGDTVSVKGLPLEYFEGDGNFVYLLTNMSGSAITIKGNTTITGSVSVSSISSALVKTNNNGTLINAVGGVDYATGSANIYNVNGALNSNRTVTLNSYSLTFSGSSTIVSSSFYLPTITSVTQNNVAVVNTASGQLTYTTASDFLQNTIDTYTASPKITQIISLSQAEFNAIGSPLSNNLYIIVS